MLGGVCPRPARDQAVVVTALVGPGQRGWGGGRGAPSVASGSEDLRSCTRAVGQLFNLPKSPFLSLQDVRSSFCGLNRQPTVVLRPSTPQATTGQRGAHFSAGPRRMNHGAGRARGRPASLRVSGGRTDEQPSPGGRTGQGFKGVGHCTAVFWEQRTKRSTDMSTCFPRTRRSAKDSQSTVKKNCKINTG